MCYYYFRWIFKNNGELMPWVIPRLDEALKHKTKWYITSSRSTIIKVHYKIDSL